MKFAIAIAFILALAMGVQSSVIPWAHSHLAEVAGHGLSYTAVSSPVHAHLLGAAPGSIAIHESAALHGGLLGGHGAIVAGHGAVVAGPAVLPHAHLGAAVLPHAHIGAAVLPHAHIGLAHEGQYLAETRGAVHAAPLAGHLNSAAAINLAPAPGTI